MSEFPNTIPPDACCDVCKEPIGMAAAACAQMVEDDDGNAVEGPFVWFHKDCLNNNTQ